MYCCAHKTATLKPIQHTVPKGEQKKILHEKIRTGGQRLQNSHPVFLIDTPD